MFSHMCLGESSSRHTAGVRPTVALLLSMGKACISKKSLQEARKGRQDVQHLPCTAGELYERHSLPIFQGSCHCECMDLALYAARINANGSCRGKKTAQTQGVVCASSSLKPSAIGNQDVDIENQQWPVSL